MLKIPSFPKSFSVYAEWKQTNSVQKGHNLNLRNKNSNCFLSLTSISLTQSPMTFRKNLRN